MFSNVIEIVRRVVAVFFVITLLSGCARLYSKEELNPLERFRRFYVNALVSNQPRPDTVQQLRISFLEHEWKRNPAKVLAALEEKIHDQGESALMPTLAELSLLHARKLDQRKDDAAAAYYLMTAAYAYDFLFHQFDPESHSFIAPLGRFMTELYNASVSRFVAILQTKEENWNTVLKFTAGRSDFEISSKREGENLWDPNYFDKFIPAYETNVKGITNYYILRGIGAPFAAFRSNAPDDPNFDPLYMDAAVFPTTAVLRFETKQVQSEHIARSAKLEFVDSIETETVAIEGVDYPLEADLTTTFGVLLAKTNPDQYTFKALRRPGRYLEQAGVYLTEPYDADKIPVVLVHGINSSPVTFVEMYNDFLGVKELRHKYQFWLFHYPTGLPIIQSSMLLRDSLESLAKRFDPDGTNELFRKMIVVGHSMGGLLAKTTIQDPGSILWDSYFSVPPDKLELSQQERTSVDSIFFYSRLPFVSRVVLVATPHKGAPIVGSFVIRRGKKLISLPKDQMEALAETLRRNEHVLEKDELAILLTPVSSVDNLRPSSRYLKIGEKIPLDPSVPVHSIISIGKAEQGPGSSDGVVKYESSHLEGVASEALIPGGHSNLRHPLTIAEVKRILLLHLDIPPARENTRKITAWKKSSTL